MIDVLEKGLPVALEAERMILGSLLTGEIGYDDLSAALSPDAFALEKHRRIMERAGEVYARGDTPERVMVARELMRHNQLESCDGITYLSELEQSRVVGAVDSYVRAVRDASTLRKAIFACQKIIDRCLSNSDGPVEILEEAETLLATVADSAAPRVVLRTPLELIQGYPGGVNGFVEPHKNKSGVASPWPSFNSGLVPVFRPGQLVIIAARPGKGKSVAAAQIALHAARSGKGAALFSLEMGGAEILTRMVCSLADVDGWKHSEGYMRAEDRARFQNATSQIATIENLWIDDSTGSTVAALHSAVRKLRASRKVDLVIIDYLQLMGALGKFDNRVAEVSSISRGLKLMARDFQVPVIALSQLSRASLDGNAAPELHHLRESGSLEQDADIVLMQHSKNGDDAPICDVEFIVRKNRGGRLGKVTMRFNKPFSRFEDPTETNAPEEMWNERE